MKQTPPSLKSAFADREAAIYYGHLLAQAEAALGAKNDESFTPMALSWITGDCLSRGGRVHQILTDDISFKGEKLGSWKLTIRVFAADPDPVEVYRKNFLESEGIRATMPAASLISDTESTEKLDAFCLAQIASHCLSNDMHKARYDIIDCMENRAMVNISRLHRPIFKNIRSLLRLGGNRRADITV
jgi:hypothetical protein